MRTGGRGSCAKVAEARTAKAARNGTLKTHMRSPRNLLEQLRAVDEGGGKVAATIRNSAGTSQEVKMRSANFLREKIPPNVRFRFAGFPSSLAWTEQYSPRRSRLPQPRLKNTRLWPAC